LLNEYSILPLKMRRKCCGDSSWTAKKKTMKNQ
jgi:hypothetical protein